jgi:8-oxo-dGTP pyrophosphatase MutT (NUDIX family)
MEQGESLELAAVRETFEETGVKIDPDVLELYSIISLPELSQVYVNFRAELDAIPDMQAGPECLEVKMIAENEIEFSQIAFPVIVGEDNLKSILFREIRNRSFAIHKWCVEGGAVRAPSRREYYFGLSRPVP